MKSSARAIANDEDLLGLLAMKFRRATNLVERGQIARQYSAAVDRLIESGIWEEAPAPEDQLPNAEMPSAFFGFWSR